MKFLNIAAYKFVKLDDLENLRAFYRLKGEELDLRGTVMVSPEGINLMLAGTPENIRKFQEILANNENFADLHYKESYSNEQTYNRYLVKVKKEIIAFGVDSIDPIHDRAPVVDPVTLKEWLDEKRDVVLIDTRNDYEVRLGTFEGAADLQIKHFRDFPAVVEQLDPALKEKTVVTFCTGGIRCEKAALYMQQRGFKDIYQLEGGILDYFLECGAAHYQGECFVFDRRVGVDGKLEETGTQQCFMCLQPLTVEEQKDPRYIPVKSCPYCYENE